MKRKYIIGSMITLCLIVAGLGIYKYAIQKNTDSVEGSVSDIDPSLGDYDNAPPVLGISVSPQEISATPKDTSALDGYNVLIADEDNGRLLEVTPDKKIVWEYKFGSLTQGVGADDSFFTDNGKTVIVNLENYQLIQQIDYATKKVIWSYGVGGIRGSVGEHLNNPDDAYKLPNGDVTVADIKNCRILEIAPDKHIVRQYGKAGQCSNKKGFLNKPNGDTPLPNGHMFISNIVGHNVIELDENWHPVLTVQLPLQYPSDPQLTQAGNILIADYMNPGKIIEISKQGKVLWEYDGEGNVKLNRPSLAIELPNGNILANDDYNHRVIVIDKQTKKIIWQYGVTGKPGIGYGQLNTPDGLDIIKRTDAFNITNAEPMVSAFPIYTVGEITRHTGQFVGQTVLIKGYLIKKEPGYIIFSDEPTGLISSYDLPITGQNIDLLQSNHLYSVEGTFLDHGLVSSNGNKFHLELTTAPILDQ